MKFTPITESSFAKQYEQSQSTSVTIESWEDWQSFLGGFNQDWINSTTIDIETIHSYFPNVSMASIERMLGSARNTTSAEYQNQIDNEVMLSLTYVVSSTLEEKRGK